MRHPKRVSKRATSELAGFQADLIPPPPRVYWNVIGWTMVRGRRPTVVLDDKGGDKILIARSFSFPFFFFFFFLFRPCRYRRGGERSLVTMRTTSSSSILTKPRVLYERHGHYSFQRELWTGICYQGPYFAPVHAFFFSQRLSKIVTRKSEQAPSSTILTKIHRDNPVASLFTTGLDY